MEQLESLRQRPAFRPRRQANVQENRLTPACVAAIQTAGNDRGHSLGNGPTYYTIPRPMRGKPWFIEYDDANGVRQKSWFNLNMP